MARATMKRRAHGPARGKGSKGVRAHVAYRVFPSATESIRSPEEANLMLRPAPWRLWRPRARHQRPNKSSVASTRAKSCAVAVETNRCLARFPPLGCRGGARYGRRSDATYCDRRPATRGRCNDRRGGNGGRRQRRRLHLAG